MSDYAVNWAKFEAPLDGLQWMIAKLNRRPTNWMVVGMAAARVSIHMRGTATALNCH